MRQLIKDFLSAEDGWINYALMGAGALASYLSGKSTKKQNQEQTSSSTTTSTPTLDPEISSARSKILQTYLNRLSDNNAGYLTSYTGNALKTSDRTSDLQQQALDAMLASRGLTGSVAGLAAKRKSLSESFADKINTLSQVPLLSRQLQNEDLSGLSGVVASAPYGTTQTNNSKTTGQTTTPGNWQTGLESGISSGISIAALLNKYYSKGW